MSNPAAQSIRVAVATGSRAEFGLLTPVMRAVREHPDLELRTIVLGSHLVGPAETWRDVETAFGIDARVPMQHEGKSGRLEDARALGLGLQGMSDAIERLRPDWIVVLGDRIEALAAAAAASVAGIPVAHLHGGDRAEGVADEAMRHAITKLSHLHFPATAESAQRIIRMGEHPSCVILAGSPAIDDLDAMSPLDEEAFARLNRPGVVFLMHPIGRAPEDEQSTARAALDAAGDRRVLALLPNLDPGREGIVEALRQSGVPTLAHLPRPEWIALLKRVAIEGGVLVGNSSAGLIEASAIRPYPLAAVNIGPRQQARESPPTVVHAAESADDIRRAIEAAVGLSAVWRKGNPLPAHPYGEGCCGPIVAEALATRPPHRSRALLRKQNAY